MYNGEKVIIKSIFYDETSLKDDEDYHTFLNYIDEEVNVAAYIDPGVVTSDDQELIVTMSKFAKGYNPFALPPN